MENFEEIYKYNQPLFYKMVNNFKTKNKIPHALIIKNNSDLNSLLIAEELINFFCDNLSNYNKKNIFIIDGDKELVKKKNIIDLQSFFVNNLTEKTFYIINSIDNSTKEAINSLLKFIEEPPENVFAILTTKNEKKVLDTILSRCFGLELKRNDNKLENENIKSSYNNDKFDEIYDLSNSFISMIMEKKDLLFFSHQQLQNTIKTNQDFSLFLDLLEINILKTINDNKLIRNQEILKSFDNILFYKDKISYNLNVNLLIDSFIIDLRSK